MGESTAFRGSSDDGENIAKPFLKWAGGKRQLLPILFREIPGSFSRYCEPFLGGGALFFALQPTVLSVLADANADLMNAYTVVRDQVETLISDLKTHIYQEEYFYALRQADRDEAFRDWAPYRRASRLIFLNRSCFNGLYRVNAKGYFNVPFGRHVNPILCDERTLRACSRALQGVVLRQEGFEALLESAKEGDFFYLDPPYEPLSETSNFSAYNSNGFPFSSQELLAKWCRELDKRGARFLLSNSSAPRLMELYEGFSIQTVPALRAINSRASARGAVDEILVKNY